MCIHLESLCNSTVYFSHNMKMNSYTCVKKAFTETTDCSVRDPTYDAWLVCKQFPVALAVPLLNCFYEGHVSEGWPRDAYPHQLVTVCRTERGPALSENVVLNTESSLTVCSVCVRQDRANEASFTRLGSGRCEKKIVVSLACPGRTLSFFGGMVERNRTSAHLRSFA